MTDRALRHRCMARLSTLPHVKPFVLAEFCRLLGEQRGRPLHVHAMSETQSVAASGVWVSTDLADHIFHDNEASPLHREHIVLHEVGHIVANHKAESVLHGEDAAVLFPDLDGEVVARVLARTTYGHEAEREAELMATLIARRAGRPAVPHADPTVDALRGRLRSALS